MKKRKTNDNRTEDEIRRLKDELSETNSFFMSSFAWLALMVLALGLMVMLAL